MERVLSQMHEEVVQAQGRKHLQLGEQEDHLAKSRSHGN